MTYFDFHYISLKDSFLSHFFFFIQSISHTTRQSSKSISYILALTFHFFQLFFCCLLYELRCVVFFCSTLANAAWKHIYLLRQESWAEYYCVDKTWTHNSEFIMQINRAVRLLRISHLLCCLCFVFLRVEHFNLVACSIASFPQSKLAIWHPRTSFAICVSKSLPITHRFAPVFIIYNILIDRLCARATAAEEKCNFQLNKRLNYSIKQQTTQACPQKKIVKRELRLKLIEWAAKKKVHCVLPVYR